MRNLVDSGKIGRSNEQRHDYRIDRVALRAHTCRYSFDTRARSACSRGKVLWESQCVRASELANGRSITVVGADIEGGHRCYDGSRAATRPMAFSSVLLEIDWMRTVCTVLTASSQESETGKETGT